jgi:hypothetical protein
MKVTIMTRLLAEWYVDVDTRHCSGQFLVLSGQFDVLF